MFPSIKTVIVTMAALATTALAQSAPPILPADMPYFYNPESAVEFIDINGGVANSNVCGVDYITDLTAYTFRLPSHMDRVGEAPFRTNDIIYLCNTGGPITSQVAIENDYPGESALLTADEVIQWQLGIHTDAFGYRTIIESVADVIYQQYLLGGAGQSLSAALLETSLENTFDDCLIPTEDALGNMQAPSCSSMLDCHTVLDLYSNSYDALQTCWQTIHILPPAWDWDDEHADTKVQLPALPKEFIADFIRHEKRMMAIMHNFHVQNNDGSVTAYDAYQNLFRFQALVGEQLLDDLVQTYSDWYDSTI